MGQATKKHIHRYMRTQLRFAKVWRCTIPTCNHYLPPHMEAMIEGRASICWGCGNQFTLDETALQDDMPTCINCRSENFDKLTSENNYVKQIG